MVVLGCRQKKYTSQPGGGYTDDTNDALRSAGGSVGKVAQALSGLHAWEYSSMLQAVDKTQTAALTRLLTRQMTSSLGAFLWYAE